MSLTPNQLYKTASAATRKTLKDIPPSHQAQCTTAMNKLIGILIKDFDFDYSEGSVEEAGEIIANLLKECRNNWDSPRHIINV